jgi:putative ABC transport system ATP-binding protein
MLKLDDVSRDFASGSGTVRALRNVTFAVEAGELVAVTGPSGSGKSTLLAVAGGLDVPSSGMVILAGKRLTGMSSVAIARMRRDHVGYVFQDYNLIASLTATENVALPRELAGVRMRHALRQARTALEEVGLGELGDRYPDQLSGGERQRVAIARALVGQRRLVLADEPTGALDSKTGEGVLATLRERVRAGAACVLVTHEPRYVRGADRVVRLVDGMVAP